MGNPALEHLQTAEGLTTKASHQFAQAAAITVDQNVKAAVRAAEQRAIDAFAMGKEAEVKLIGSDVVRKNSFSCVPPTKEAPTQALY